MTKVNKEMVKIREKLLKGMHQYIIEIGDEEIYCAFLGLADHVCDGSFDYGKYHYGQRDVAELDEEICLAELGYVIGVEYCSSRYIEIREKIHAHVTEQCDESREQTDVK